MRIRTLALVPLLFLLTACGGAPSPAAPESTPSPEVSASPSAEAYQYASPSLLLGQTAATPSLVLTSPSPVSDTPAPKPATKVTFVTPEGTIVATLSRKDAPKTVANFEKLVRAGFYDGLTWHRVVNDFVIQTGDPTGTGGGGSKETIPLEIKCADGKTIEGSIAPASCNPVLKHKEGALGMARTNDPNSASSQFYIVTGPASFLDRSYAVFGYVTEGLDIAKKIHQGDTITKVTVE